MEKSIPGRKFTRLSDGGSGQKMPAKIVIFLLEVKGERWFR